MNLLETLEKTFNKKPNFITANGELEKWVIINKAQKYDEELIELLLSEKELKDKFFKKLTLKQQKEHLCELLDKTQLFVNLSSIDEADIACIDEEKGVTKDFYGL